jgi:hypothetical protein
VSDIRERLTAALDSFEEKLKESRQDLITPSQLDRDLLIDALTPIAFYDSGQAARAFRTPSRETTQKELSEIAKRASDLATRLRDPKCSVTRAREQLAQRLEEMRETTIFALADLNIAFIRLELPGLLLAEATNRERLANELDFLAQAAAQAEAPDTVDEGRWPDRRAQAVARILARFYREATEQPPTISTFVGGPNEGDHHGLFLDLVSLIFAAMNMEHDAYSFARRAADELCEESTKKSTS